MCTKPDTKDAVREVLNEKTAPGGKTILEHAIEDAQDHVIAAFARRFWWSIFGFIFILGMSWATMQVQISSVRDSQDQYNIETNRRLGSIEASVSRIEDILLSR